MNPESFLSNFRGSLHWGHLVKFKVLCEGEAVVCYNNNGTEDDREALAKQHLISLVSKPRILHHTAI